MDFGSLDIYSVNFMVCLYFRVCLYSHLFTERIAQASLISYSVQVAFLSFKNETVLPRFIKGLLCPFLSTQKWCLGRSTAKLEETKFLFLCMPRGDVVVMRSLAPISCLKEILDYKLSRREACQEASSDGRLTGWGKSRWVCFCLLAIEQT